MKRKNNSKFYFKKVSALTKDEKQQMMHLMIATYPAFKKYYLKNQFYSTVKPQMEHLIKNGRILIGVGKLLWRKVNVGKTSIKFFAFGVLIIKKYQGLGLGTKIIKKDIKEAKKRGADILYGSTENPIAEKIVKKLGFKKLDVAVFYKDTETGITKREQGRSWVFEFKNGIIKRIENLQRFYIGTGPL